MNGRELVVPHNYSVQTPLLDDLLIALFIVGVDLVGIFRDTSYEAEEDLPQFDFHHVAIFRLFL